MKSCLRSLWMVPKCFDQASDSIVDCYLLQLAQALKHESFFQCDLVEFLLERSLNNMYIGHHLFWELKAEMSTTPSVGLFYGLILEAYLVAAPEHLKMLDQQLRFLDKCRSSQGSKKTSSIMGGRGEAGVNISDYSHICIWE